MSRIAKKDQTGGRPDDDIGQEFEVEEIIGPAGPTGPTNTPAWDTSTGTDQSSQGNSQETNTAVPDPTDTTQTEENKVGEDNSQQEVDTPKVETEETEAPKEEEKVETEEKVEDEEEPKVEEEKVETSKEEAGQEQGLPQTRYRDGKSIYDYDDWLASELQYNARQKVKQARHERNMRNLSNAAMAIAPELLKMGIKAGGDIFGNIRRMTSAFFSGGPMSAASSMLADSITATDTVGRMTARASKEFGIAENADRKIVEGTAKGRLMYARTEAERMGVAMSMAQVDKLLTDLGVEDINELDMDQLALIYSDIKLSIDDHREQLKNPEQGVKEKRMMLGALNQYSDILKELDARNKELGRISREDASRLRQQMSDARRIQRETSAAEAQARYDNGTDIQRFVWDSSRRSLDLDENGVPRDGRGLPGLITAVDAALGRFDEYGNHEDPSYSGPSKQELEKLLADLEAKDIELKGKRKERNRERDRNPDGTYGSTYQMQQDLRDAQERMDAITRDMGFEGETIESLRAQGRFYEALQLAQNAEYRRAFDDKIRNELALEFQGLKNNLRRNGHKLGLSQADISSMESKLYGQLVNESRERDASRHYIPKDRSDVLAHIQFYNELLDDHRGVQNVERKLRERGNKVRAEGGDPLQDDQYRALNDLYDAMRDLDPEGDPRGKLERIKELQAASRVAWDQARDDERQEERSQQRAGREEARAQREAERKAEREANEAYKRRQAKKEGEAKAKEAREKEKAKRKAEYTRKMSKLYNGTMSKTEAQEFMDDVQDRLNRFAPGTKEHDRALRDKMTFDVGRRFANMGRRVDGLEKGGVLSMDQADRIRKTMKELRDNALRGIKGGTPSESKIADFNRAHDVLEVLTGKEASRLRNEANRELGRLWSAPDDDPLKVAYDDLLNVLDDFSELTPSSVGTADTIRRRFNTAKANIEKVKQEIADTSQYGDTPSPTASGRRAVMARAESEIGQILSDHNIPLNKFENGAFVDLMTANPELKSNPAFVRAVNQWIMNNNALKMDQWQKQVNNMLSGQDQMTRLAILAKLRNTIEKDNELRAGTQWTDHSLLDRINSYQELFDQRNSKLFVDVSDYLNQPNPTKELVYSEKYQAAKVLKDLLGGNRVINENNVDQLADQLARERSRFRYGKGPVKPKEEEKKEEEPKPDQFTAPEEAEAKDREEIINPNVPPTEEIKPKRDRTQEGRNKKLVGSAIDAMDGNGMFRDEVQKAKIESLARKYAQNLTTPDKISGMFDTILRFYEGAVLKGKTEQAEDLRLQLDLIDIIGRDNANSNNKTKMSNEALRRMGDELRRIDQEAADRRNPKPPAPPEVPPEKPPEKVEVPPEIPPEESGGFTPPPEDFVPPEYEEFMSENKVIPHGWGRGKDSARSKLRRDHLFRHDPVGELPSKVNDAERKALGEILGNALMYPKSHPQYKAAMEGIKGFLNKKGLKGSEVEAFFKASERAHQDIAKDLKDNYKGKGWPGHNTTGKPIDLSTLDKLSKYKPDPKKGGPGGSGFQPMSGHPGHNDYRIKQADLKDEAFNEAFKAAEQNILGAMGPALEAGDLIRWALRTGPESQVVAYLMDIGDNLDQPHLNALGRWASMRDEVMNGNIEDPRFNLKSEEGRRNLLLYSVYDAMKDHVKSNGESSANNDPKAYSLYMYLQKQLKKTGGK